MTTRSDSGEFSLSPQRKELLSLLLHEKGFQPSARQRLGTRPDRSTFPLSFAQERLWFLSQLDPQSVYYNIPMALLCTGRLDLAALEKSLNTILARHEVLRAVFRNVDGQPVQHIVPLQPISLSPIDLDAFPAVDGEDPAQRFILEEAQQPFDLEQGPLLRVRLLRRSAHEHLLLMTVHHIVADGLSYGVLMQELQAVYTAAVAHTPAVLPEMPFQFADYAHWQRQWLLGADMERKLGYWRRQLAGLAPGLDLPLDHPRPPVQTYQGARCGRALPQALTEALNAFSRKQGVSLFVTLLAAFNVLLYRYTGQRDIVVGSPVANRDHPDLENLIGLFINTLVLRAKLSDRHSFRDLTAAVSQTVLEAYEHQELPFEKLVEVLQPERDLSRSPLFQVFFNFQNSLVMHLDLPQVTLRLLEQQAGIAKFDLSVDIQEREERLFVSLEYNTDLFEAGSLERMLENFQALLAAAVADPEAPLGLMPALAADERRELLEVANATHRDYAPLPCFQRLFEAQAERSPEAVAVYWQDRHLTYRALNQQSNQLAHYLQRLGVGPEVLVGVCLDRSLEMLVGLLGVLKAGGAYVPLDPAYPRERLDFMLSDTRAPVLLSQQSLLALFPEEGIEIVCLDRDREKIALEPTETPDSRLLDENPSHVIYTSGSTGQPKGVLIRHRSVAVFLHWVHEVFGSDLSGVLASTSICFDLSVFELFGPLSWGGAVVLAENVLQLPTVPACARVSLVNSVPSAMAELLATGGVPPWVRTINLAGEPLRPVLVNQLYDQGAVQRVFDLYGPSEDTTYSTFTQRAVDGPATIGRPIANTQVYLLDGNLQPVPTGAIGEIYIGGEGLARGYLNRPGLTAERFVPNPFTPSSFAAKRSPAGEGGGARLYKTGDLARYLPDKSIEFLGRQDLQVKIRGFRIELGEVETTLAQHPAVKDAVAIVRESRLGDKQIVAYIVPDSGQPPTFTSMREFLSRKLPGYMLPSAFIMLPALPMTPNGKVDRRTLQTLGTAPVDPRAESVAPRTPVEVRLAEIWAEVLQQDQIGVHDNFFELGGHSLLATRIISRVQKVLQVPLSLRLFYQAPTIADMAQHIAAFQRGETGLEAGEAPIQRRPRSETEQVLANLDQLSDGEIDTLLEQILSESK